MFPNSSALLFNSERRAQSCFIVGVLRENVLPFLALKSLKAALCEAMADIVPAPAPSPRGAQYNTGTIDAFLPTSAI